MADKRLRDLDDGSALVAATDFIPVDRAGLDEVERVTLQQAVDATDVSGAYVPGGTDVPVTDGGTGASTAAAARTNLDVDQAGTDNSTDVTLAGTPDYITIAGQVITRNLIDLTTDVTGVLPEANLPNASATAEGVVELATDAETETGTDTARAVTPANVASAYVKESLADAKGDLWAATAADTMGRLPVGTNDQVLTADSAEATGMKWADAAAGGGGVSALPSGVPSGAYLSTLFGEYATLGGVQDRVYFHPLDVDAAFTGTEIGVSLNSGGGASSVLRFGIWNDDGAGRPGTLVLDAGTVASSTAGYKSIAISQALSATTKYWVGVCAQADTAPTYRGIGSTQAGAKYASPANSDQIGFYQDSVTGAFAAGAPTINGDNAVCPRITVKR